MFLHIARRLGGRRLDRHTFTTHTQEGHFEEYRTWFKSMVQEQDGDAFLDQGNKGPKGGATAKRDGGEVDAVDAAAGEEGGAAAAGVATKKARWQ